MNLPSILLGFLIGYIFRGKVKPHATRSLPSATATVAQAMAGNADAIARVNEQRARAAAGDLEAIGYVADLGAAYMMAEIQKHIVDTTMAPSADVAGDEKEAA